MNRKVSTNPAIGRRVVARNVLDFWPEGTVVPASLTGVIIKVEHHETDPWTRYTVKFDSGDYADGLIMGQDIKTA